ncbi:hypothetical protein BDF21DRAFT_466266 [Thamnidium elegans]|nr:hypothetical protein BDF21DRAFT_466266 [Thamnidium elegans]
MEFRPDRNTEGSEKFKEIVNAYNALSCVKSRRKHDAELPEALNVDWFSNGSRSRSSYTSTSRSTKRQKATADGRYHPSTSPATSSSPSLPSPPPRRFDYDIRAITHITLNQSYTGLAQHRVTYVETINCNTYKHMELTEKERKTKENIIVIDDDEDDNNNHNDNHNHNDHNHNDDDDDEGDYSYHQAYSYYENIINPANSQNEVNGRRRRRQIR